MFGYVILVRQQVASVRYRSLKPESTEAMTITGALGKITGQNSRKKHVVWLTRQRISG